MIDELDIPPAGCHRGWNDFHSITKQYGKIQFGETNHDKRIYNHPKTVLFNSAKNKYSLNNLIQDYWLCNHKYSRNKQLTYSKKRSPLYITNLSTTHLLAIICWCALAASTVSLAKIVPSQVKNADQSKQFTSSNLGNITWLNNNANVNNDGLIDDRLCITATYLCVLIVNNTLIDCNLLETLCKKSNNNNRLSIIKTDLVNHQHNIQRSPIDTTINSQSISATETEQRATTPGRSLTTIPPWFDAKIIETIDDQENSEPANSRQLNEDSLSDMVAIATTFQRQNQPINLSSTNPTSNGQHYSWQARSAGPGDSVWELEENGFQDNKTNNDQNYLQFLPISRVQPTKIQDDFDIISSLPKLMSNSYSNNQHQAATSSGQSQSFKAQEPDAEYKQPSTAARLESSDEIGSFSGTDLNFASHYDDQSDNKQTLITEDSPTTSASVAATPTTANKQTDENGVLISQTTPKTTTSSGGIWPSWVRVPFRWGSISIWPISVGQQVQQDEIASSSSQAREYDTTEKSASEHAIDQQLQPTIHILRPMDGGASEEQSSFNQIQPAALSVPATSIENVMLLMNQTISFNQVNNHINENQQTSSKHQMIPQQSIYTDTDLQELPIINNSKSNKGQKLMLFKPQVTTNELVAIEAHADVVHQPKRLTTSQSPSNINYDSAKASIDTLNQAPPVACDCDPMYQLASPFDNRASMRSISQKMYSDCRVQCFRQDQLIASGQSSLNNQNMLMTSSETSANPITAPSSTHSSLPSIGLNSSPPPSINNNGQNLNLQPTSGAKVAPPLEVNFILYTRHHRDLANQHAKDSLAIDSITNIASNHLMMGGDLIDISNETTTPGNSISNNIVSINCCQTAQPLNSSLPIKMIIHGFGSGARRPWVADMVYKLLEYEDVNVIVVDWEKGATLPNYVQAAGNTRLVGHKIANFIRGANLKYGFTGQQYHLIGFSLGAHVAGFAGMECNSTQLSPRIIIQRITGLDPASPLFEGYEANDRLDPSDAKFVDVIHSNGDGVLRGGFGSLQPMGHVDFYPNGGRVQVGCNSVLLSALSDIIYGKWQSLCNHRRALNFFMDSFEYAKCRFRSFKCDSYESYLRGECFDCGHNNEGCSYMGYRANQSRARGKMYLTTHEDAPFCANQLIIKLIGTKGYKTTWGKIEVTLVSNEFKNESFWLSPSLNRDRERERSRGSTDPDRDQHNHNSYSEHSSPTSPSISPSSSPSQTTASVSSSTTGLVGNGNPVLSGLTGSNNKANPTTVMNVGNNMNPSVDTQQGSNSVPSEMSLQSLIVSHQNLSNLTHVLLRYTRYKGWIYSGDESWSIDKVFIMDSDGAIKSFCGSNTILESHITTRVNLELGNCTVAEPPCCQNGANRALVGSGMQSDEPTPSSDSASPNSRAQHQGQTRVQSSANTINQLRIPRLYATILQNKNSKAMAKQNQQEQEQQQRSYAAQQIVTQQRFGQQMTPNHNQNNWNNFQYQNQFIAF